MSSLFLVEKSNHLRVVYVSQDLEVGYAYGGKYETSALRHPIHRLVQNTVHPRYSDRPKLSESWTDALF
jgi:hypothetical protein